jgi:methionyl-tRNA formyltransferase
MPGRHRSVNGRCDLPSHSVSHSLPGTVAICGKGRIASSALSFAVHWLHARGLRIPVLACPNTDDRGYDTWQESLAATATRLGVPRTVTADLEGDGELLLVSLEYDRLIPVDRFASRRLYNLHFSALPKYRGVYTSIWPLLNDEPETGVTLHELAKGADTGPIVAQRRFPIPGHTTARLLYEMYMREATILFHEWFPRIVECKPVAVPQDDAVASSYNRKSLDLRHMEVDLSKAASDVCRQVRAFHFPEYQLPMHRGRAIRAATELGLSTDQPAGTVLLATAYSSSLATGAGDVVELIWA